MKLLLMVVGGLVVWGAISGGGAPTGGPPTAATEIPTHGGHGPVVVGLLVVALVGWACSRRNVQRIHIRPHRDHAHGTRTAVIHEALGHAAVAHGVGAKGIRARVYPDGSGWCEASRSGLTLAESLAITAGGEAAAGPEGCSADRARFARDARRAPRRYRDQVKGQAMSLAGQHVGNAFGHKVARSLSRTGRFR